MPSAAPYTKLRLEHADADNDDDNNARFDRPRPAAWKRAALVVFLAVLFWLAFYIRPTTKHAPNDNVVHASRYSKEFKYRPAASPVITERLKDGRVRLRGALPT